MNNPIWTHEKFTRGQAWVDLLMLAKWKGGYFYHRDIKVNYERGQITEGVQGLSKRWGWSRTKTKKFINDLENEQQITQQISNVITLISVTNYDTYQIKGSRKNSSNTAAVQQQDTHKESKEGKRSNNVGRKFIPPTLKDVEIYAEEYLWKQNGSRFSSHSIQNVANNFMDFYQSNGWKVGSSTMKDWQAAFKRSLKWDDSVKAIKEGVIKEKQEYASL